MKVLELDDEQAAMIIIALEASNALLEARSHRVDPDGILTNSFNLQRKKIDQIKRQMEGGNVALWSELQPGAQVQATQIASVFIGIHPDEVIAAAYDKLVNFALSQRAPVKPSKIIRKAG